MAYEPAATSLMTAATADVTSATCAMTPAMSQSLAVTWLSTGDDSPPST
jgi:hypothetical protein